MPVKSIATSSKAIFFKKYFQRIIFLHNLLIIYRPHCDDLPISPTPTHWLSPPQSAIESAARAPSVPLSMLDMFDMPSEFAVSQRPMSRQRAVADLQTPLRGASGAKKKKRRGSKKKSPSSAKKVAADAAADGSETAAAAADSVAAANSAEPSGADHQLSDDDDGDSGDASSGDDDVTANDTDTDDDDDDDEAREDEAAAARKFAAVQAKVKQEFVAGQQHLKSTLKYGRVQ
jgi:hypothetical protein